MNILGIDRYLDVVGGRERYVAEWMSLMRSHGHSVRLFAFRSGARDCDPENDDLPDPLDTGSPSAIKRIAAAGQRLYNGMARERLARLLDRDPCDIAHTHSIFHLSASVIFELRRRRIPIVWTLHDYNAICPNSLLFTHDAICEACWGSRFVQAAFKRCSHGSLSASALNAVEAYYHRAIDLYSCVDTFIAPSRFALEKFVSFGWPRTRLLHVPHFALVQHWKPVPVPRRGSIVFVGRFNREKGAHVLLEALHRVRLPATQEVIFVGDGPERGELERMANDLIPGRVRFIGRLGLDAIRAQYEQSLFAVVPSVCQEVFGLAVLEPFAIGRSVIGTRVGGIPEIIEDGVSGLLVAPGDADALASAIDRMLMAPARVPEMGAAARLAAEARFDPDTHYSALMSIYDAALGRVGHDASHSW